MITALAIGMASGLLIGLTLRRRGTQRLIASAVADYAAAHPEFADPDGTAEDPADGFAALLRERGVPAEVITVTVRGTGELHRVVLADGDRFDFAARRFDPDAPFPYVTAA